MIRKQLEIKALSRQIFCLKPTLIHIQRVQYIYQPEPEFLDGLWVRKLIPGFGQEPSVESSQPCPIQCKFYVPKAHIMYLTIFSRYLISLVRGSGPSRAIKFLYAPAPLPPPPTWALKPPQWALVHKTTYYAPMIYTALCIMFWMRAYPLIGQVGGGWALEILNFWAPNGTRLSA